MAIPEFGFKKSERLCSKVLIDRLFVSGRSFYIKTFKIYWLNVEEPFVQPSQILISIPRKNLKRAVDRNMMKRRIREIYRKNKATLNNHLVAQSRKCVFSFVYLGKETMDYCDLEPIIILILQRLIQENVKAAG